LLDIHVVGLVGKVDRTNTGVRTNMLRDINRLRRIRLSLMKMLLAALASHIALRLGVYEIGNDTP
jgi:hypothetical protein